MKNLRKHYSKIFCQTTSHDSNHLVIGNSLGQIILYNLSHLKQGEDGVGRGKLDSPNQTYQQFEDPVYTMTSTPELLLTGINGFIHGFKWTDLVSGICKPVWSVNIKCDQANFGTTEVNSIAYNSEKHCVYAACGDWRTRCYDIETCKQTMILEGHNDYVHDVVLSCNRLATAGEDGQVLMWDCRSSKEPQARLQPFKNASLSRPALGKFISSVDIENDWLVCGGGPNAGIFHLRSMALTSQMAPLEGFIEVTKFSRQGDQGSVIVAGMNPTMNVCNISGDVTAQIQPSSKSVYSVHITDTPVTLVTVGGEGPILDVCFNLKYRDHSTKTI